MRGLKPGRDVARSYVQHARVIDIHGLLRIGGAVLVVEIDAGIVDQHIDAAVLFDFVCESFDAPVIRDVEFRVQDAARAVRRLKAQILSRPTGREEFERRYIRLRGQDALAYCTTDAPVLKRLVS